MEQLTFWSEEHPVKDSVLPEKERDCKTPEATCALRIADYLKLCAPMVRMGKCAGGT